MTMEFGAKIEGRISLLRHLSWLFDFLLQNGSRDPKGALSANSLSPFCLVMDTVDLLMSQLIAHHHPGFSLLAVLCPAWVLWELNLAQSVT